MSKDRHYVRFTVSNRIEHWVTMLSFTVLAFTGLTQKYASVEISRWFIDSLGGIESVRVIHRVSAIVMMFEAIYHIGAVGFSLYVKRSRASILPGISDLTAAVQTLLYDLGLRKERPQEGRFTFAEKAEYWFLIWGTLIMGVTGFMLWNPIITSNLLPGEFIPAAKAAHGGEAVLAVLALLLWHGYHVHIRTFNKSMFTGRISEHEMLEEHPLELADLKSGLYRQLDPAAVARRRRIFIPIYSVLALIFVVGVYLFAAYEETAIATVPPAEDVVVFAPLTPTPFPTALPTEEPSLPAAAAWKDGVGDLFASRCGSCHGAMALGGLNVTSLEAILAGGNNGPGVVAGDVGAGSILRIQSEGRHPGQFSGEELAFIRTWIENGTP